jgi:hypothetical protein
MVTEERRQEILENRRMFSRLSMDIIQGIKKTQTLHVHLRGGKAEEEYEIEVRPLTELEIAEAARRVNLTLQDLIEMGRLSRAIRDAKRQGKPPPADMSNDKQIARFKFMQEVISAGLVDPKLEPKTIDEAFSPVDQASIWAEIMRLSGQGREDDIDKFRGEPPQQSTADASV